MCYVDPIGCEVRLFFLFNSVELLCFDSVLDAIIVSVCRYQARG